MFLHENDKLLINIIIYKNNTPYKFNAQYTISFVGLKLSGVKNI